MDQDRNILLFSGWHELTMDTKGRVPVPATFRKGLADLAEDKVTLTIGPDQCLRGYARDGLVQLLGRIERQQEKNPDLGRRLKRQMISHMAELSFDSQGRVLVPPKLRVVAALDSDVIYVGCNDYFELWDRRLWEAGSRQDDEILQNHSAAKSAVFG